MPEEVEKPQPPEFDVVANVCTEAITPLRDVMPPPAPASEPQENVPSAFH